MPDARLRVAFINRCLCVHFACARRGAGCAEAHELDRAAHGASGPLHARDIHSALDDMLADGLDRPTRQVDDGATYHGGPDGMFPYPVVAPEAFVHFAQEVDAAAGAIDAALREAQRVVDAAARGAARGAFREACAAIAEAPAIFAPVDRWSWLIDVARTREDPAIAALLAAQPGATGAHPPAGGRIAEIAARIGAAARAGAAAASGRDDLERVAAAFVALCAICATGLDVAPLRRAAREGALFGHAASLWTALGVAAAPVRDRASSRPRLCPRCFALMDRPCA